MLIGLLSTNRLCSFISGNFKLVQQKARLADFREDQTVVSAGGVKIAPASVGINGASSLRLRWGDSVTFLVSVGVVVTQLDKVNQRGHSLETSALGQWSPNYDLRAG